MKFTDVTLNEACKHITKKEYLSIYEGKATHERKWKLWAGLMDDGKINPLETPLPKFYESTIDND